MFDGPTSHDFDSRRYFGADEDATEREYREERREEMKEIRKRITYGLEAIGEKFLYEDEDTQKDQMGDMRGRLNKLVSLCKEYEQVERELSR